MSGFVVYLIKDCVVRHIRGKSATNRESNHGSGVCKELKA